MTDSDTNNLAAVISKVGDAGVDMMGQAAFRPAWPILKPFVNAAKSVLGPSPGDKRLAEFAKAYAEKERAERDRSELLAQISNALSTEREGPDFELLRRLAHAQAGLVAAEVGRRHVLRQQCLLSWHLGWSVADTLRAHGEGLPHVRRTPSDSFQPLWIHGSRRLLRILYPDSVLSWVRSRFARVAATGMCYILELDALVKLHPWYPTGCSP